METKTGGKRLTAAPKEEKTRNKKRNRLPLIIGGAVAAVLAAGYLVLCAVASRDVMWRGTTMMGVDVSGLSGVQAAEKLREVMPGLWTDRSVALYEPTSGKNYAIDARDLLEAPNLAGDAAKATKGGNRDRNFLTAGGSYLVWLVTGGEVDVSPNLIYSRQGETAMSQLLGQITGDLGIDKNETSYEISDTDIRFTKGRTGVTVDRDALRQGIIDALTGAGEEPVNITLAQFPPAEPDFDAIRTQLLVEASDAYLDRDSHEVVPSVVGKDLDVEAARAALEQTAEGGDCRIPLILTQPGVDTQTLSASLFRDVLGQASTRVTGTADRKVNVGVAAKYVNDTIVFPGEEFSFNKICSPYSVSNGYGKATAYVNGLSKDTVAGGICQMSSTLYWATLRANLKTVERYAHRYEPSYISGGLDATVYGDFGDSGSLDFRFQNDTTYPIKLSAYMDDKNYLHVTIYGTNDTGVRGEPYSTNRVVTQRYQTIYEANSSIPQGTTRKDPERTGYNAVTIQTYQKLVDAQGKELSNELLYTTKYYVRNETILYNPADMAYWGIDPYTGIRSEAASAAGGAEVPSTGESAGTETPAPSGSDVSGGQIAPTQPDPVVDNDEPVPVPPAEMGQQTPPAEPNQGQEALPPADGGADATAGQPGTIAVP